MNKVANAPAQHPIISPALCYPGGHVVPSPHRRGRVPRTAREQLLLHRQKRIRLPSSRLARQDAPVSPSPTLRQDPQPVDVTHLRRIHRRRPLQLVPRAFCVGRPRSAPALPALSGDLLQLQGHQDPCLARMPHRASAGSREVRCGESHAAGSRLSRERTARGTGCPCRERGQRPPSVVLSASARLPAAPGHRAARGDSYRRVRHADSQRLHRRLLRRRHRVHAQLSVRRAQRQPALVQGSADGDSARRQGEHFLRAEQREGPLASVSGLRFLLRLRGIRGAGHCRRGRRAGERDGGGSSMVQRLSFRRNGDLQPLERAQLLRRAHLPAPALLGRHGKHRAGSQTSAGRES